MKMCKGLDLNIDFKFQLYVQCKLNINGFLLVVSFN